jgi:hypothetical protein
MSNATKSFLGKCKPCKRAVQASAIALETRDATRDRMGKVISPTRVSWKIVGGSFTGHTTPLAAAWNGKWQWTVACPGCKAQVSLTAVKGTVSEEHICGARCLASTGPNCECSCGGANHGRSHAA